MQNATDPTATRTLVTPVGGYDERTGLNSGGHRWRWLWILLIGIALWVVCIVVTAITRNSNLIPADILIGSFMVPVAAVTWNFDHRADSYLPMTRIFFAFVVGGTLGVLLAAVAEAPLSLVPVPFQFALVALIEEAAKLAALILVAQRLSRYTTTDGLVLGATVGFGFAALESAGYAFNGVVTQQGLYLPGLIQSVILRGLLAPLGHGLWTAILGLFLFHAAERHNRLRISGALIGMYFVVVGLHFLWDFSDWLAIAVAGSTLAGVALSIFFNLVVGAGGLVVLGVSWNSLVRIPRMRARQSAVGNQTAAAASWRPPPATWPPPSPPPQGYHPGPIAPPPGAWQPPGFGPGQPPGPPEAGRQQPDHGYSQEPAPPGYGQSGEPPRPGRGQGG